MPRPAAPPPTTTILTARSLPFIPHPPVPINANAAAAEDACTNLRRVICISFMLTLSLWGIGFDFNTDPDSGAGAPPRLVTGSGRSAAM
jgi:hypothetical protein